GGAINVDAGGLGKIDFSGTITATGHGGLLQVTVSNPTVQITSQTSGILTVNISATDPSGNQAASGRIVLASLSISSLSASNGQLNLTATPVLSAAGAQGFAGFYEAGEALDTLTITASLGGEVECDSTTNPTELALTGAQTAGAGDALGFAALAVLLGLGLM